ncbi:RagB/SusD family nutrient uptake outer membrane protein [Lewinella sp. JB7]|uniref:RagB/SusD family nutrient uptake outer membrane protein n=1 Tax=Lewinella sp. JB7 TaxID=2962887 RepID=UPI0020C99403|nr:RagB/SusD family nutrient uptake outer membrane protein [Lewinella sp. JB7]MCP9236206.1 RagB/SusD family nutrient uptake outer membrane protein [Lewinella sp. JB7]
MQIKNITLGTLAAMLLGITACTDQLDVVDPNRLSTGQYYQNETQAVAAVDAIYNALIIDGMYQRMTPIYADGRGDEISSRSPWPFLTGLSSFVVPGTDGALEIYWAGHYIMVSRANQALENIPKIDDVDAELRERLLGQAHFLRALAYFNLTNALDNVPLVLETPDGVESFYPSNETVTHEMVYAQVKSDLEGAISRLPVNYDNVSGTDQGQEGRATKGAAQALLGQVYLYEGNYAEALPLFAAVINSGEYALAANYADLFSQDPGVENANPGKIFWADFTTSTSSEFNWGGDPNVNWRQFLALTPTYSVGDFFDFFPTNFLYTEMRKERTVDGKLDPRYHATLLSYEPDEGYTTAYGQDWFERGYGENDYFIKKYTNAATGSDAFSAGFDYHIIRYADVLLMYAESLAKTGDIATAAAYVQQVRDRANLPDREAEFAAYSPEQFMDQLEHERIMELAIEGKRWYDLKRWDYLQGAKLEELKSHDFEFNTFTPGEDEYLPIPQTEIDRNPNLVGNAAN